MVILNQQNFKPLLNQNFKILV